MCFGDWRAGRLIRSVTHALLTQASPDLILPANPQRVGVTICCTDVLGTFIGYISAIEDDTANVLFISPASSSPFHITLATHGDLPTRRLVLALTGGASTLGSVIEYMATEEMLAVAIEQFNTEYGRRF